jgi:NTP pyrophosphatase (non-canonical NTP hydrolase)
MSLDDLANIYSLKDYARHAQATAVFPETEGLEYLALGLTGEAGEVANQVKKVLRGDTEVILIENKILDELGDVLWYVTLLAYWLGSDLQQVAANNLIKLRKRQKGGTLKGDKRDE